MSFTNLINAIDAQGQALTSNATAKDLVYLGKAVEAMTIPQTVADIQDEGATQVAAVASEGATQVAAVQAAGADYAQLAGATFTGDVTMQGNLTVSGTTTTVNSTTLDVADLNITVASGASDASAANGAGITVDGAGATILYTSATDSWDFNKPITGSYTNLHPAVTTASVTTTQNVSLNDPMSVLTMTAATTFTPTDLAAGKTAMFILDTSATPFTPSFAATVKWPAEEEPTWADSRYWIVTMAAVDGTNVLASAQGYTV